MCESLCRCVFVCVVVTEWGLAVSSLPQLPVRGALMTQEVKCQEDYRCHDRLKRLAPPPLAGSAADAKGMQTLVGFSAQYFTFRG